MIRTAARTLSSAGGATCVGAAFLVAAGLELLVSCGSDDSSSAFHHLDASTGGTNRDGGVTAGNRSTGGVALGGSGGGVSGAPASGGMAGGGSGGRLEPMEAGVVADSGTNRDGGASPDGATASPDASGSEDAGEPAPGMPNPELFGTPCLKTSNCGPGLVCITSASNTYGGGIPNGLCTLDCSLDLLSPVDTASVCARISDTAVCAQTSPTKAFCTEACTFGSGVDPSDKCHGRKDMACTAPDAFGSGYCRAVCRGDFDCGGRLCDLASGLCKDSLPAYRRLPIGTKCDPSAAPDPCEGVCIELDDGTGPTGTGFCSGYCRLGATPDCGANPSSNAAPTASCLYPAGYDNPDLGDIAICAPLCDCNDDCASRDFICDPVPGLMAELGRLGTCTLPSAAAGDPAGMACN